MTKIRKVSPENPEGITRDMTPEEQASYDADVTRLATEEANKETEKQAQEDLKSSAKAKLVSGENLTQEEADTIIL